MFKCSVPGCNHFAVTILNSHYIESHGLTKSKAKKLYGNEMFLGSAIKNKPYQINDQKQQAVTKKMKQKMNR